MKDSIYHRRKATALISIDEKIGAGILSRVRDKQAAEVELLEHVAARATAGRIEPDGVAVQFVTQALEHIGAVSGVGDALLDKISQALVEGFGLDGNTI